MKWLYLVIALSLLCGATDGPRSPSTAEDYDVGVWSNPSGASASDDTRATVTLQQDTVSPSHLLKVTGFGFNVPATATIDGVLVEIERSAFGFNGTIKDEAVHLVNGGSIAIVSNKASTATWPTTDAYASYGGATDLWDQTLTPAVVNAANFGVAIAAKETSGGLRAARIDHIRVTVYYTE